MEKDTKPEAPAGTSLDDLSKLFEDIKISPSLQNALKEVLEQDTAHSTVALPTTTIWALFHSNSKANREGVNTSDRKAHEVGQHPSASTRQAIEYPGKWQQV